jgi:hypothetical protein
LYGIQSIFGWKSYALTGKGHNEIGEVFEKGNNTKLRGGIECSVRKRKERGS